MTLRGPDSVHVDAALERVTPLFDVIGGASFDGVGFTRAAYGPAEQAAHDTVAAAAREIGLEISVDAARNMTLTLPGRDRSLPSLALGSHLDAVPQGGNFDGLAGVLAALAVTAAWRAAGMVPLRDLSVFVLRAEESAWFSAQHIGSRAMLGMLPAEVLTAARRIDDGRTLVEHMREAGVDPRAIVPGRALRDLRSIAAFVELHIEQGPLLVERGVPLGIVSGIRGNRRAAQAVCRGAYGHSGTVPRALRRDAVFAVADLVKAMDGVWGEVEAEGGDLVLTFGQLTTDPAAHSVTTIPGQAAFSVDIRSHEQATLARIEAALHREAEAIARRRGVTFAFGLITRDAPTNMDAALRALLAEGAAALGIAAIPLASGAGHDAGDFANAGVPTAMVFVRNDNGSHNPHEAMEMSDLAEGVRLLTWFTARFGDVR